MTNEDFRNLITLGNTELKLAFITLIEHMRGDTSLEAELDYHGKSYKVRIEEIN